MEFRDYADVTKWEELDHIKAEIGSLLELNKELSKYTVIFIDVPVVSKSEYYPVLHKNYEDKYIYVYIVRPSTDVHTTDKFRWVTNPLYHVVIDNFKLRNNLKNAVDTLNKLLHTTNSAEITDYKLPDDMVRKCTVHTTCTNGLTVSEYITKHVLVNKIEKDFETIVTNNEDVNVHISAIKKLISEVIEDKKQRKFSKIDNYRAFCSDIRVIKLVEAYNTLVSE